MILVESEEEIQTGYVLSENQKVITATELSEINENYPDNLDLISEDQYVLMIIKDEMFEDLSEQIEYENTTFEKEQLTSAIKAESAQGFLTELDLYKEDLGIADMDDDELIKNKAAVSGILLSEMAQNPSKLVASIKSKDIEIHPPSFTISLLNQLPTSAIEGKLKDMTDQIEI
jgi:hypothetical protein